MTSSLIDQLVEHRGIESNYTDAWGKPATIESTVKKKLLNVMGYKVDDQATLEEQVKQGMIKDWLTPLNPVHVQRNNDALSFFVRLPIELVTDEYTAQITLESGDVQRVTFEPIEGELVNVNHIDEIEFHEYFISIECNLPLGYHTLALVVDDESLSEMRVIIAPDACYQPQTLVDGNKVWGLSVQLYCVRSDHNWGIGDFSDLAYLTAKAAKTGADFIGLNPIHSLYPANPGACSPYGPSSRRWLNFIYIDVTAIDGFHQQSVQAIVNQADFKESIDHARAADLVDYPSVTKLKLDALSAVFDWQAQQYLRKNTQQNRSFKAFIEQGGESLQTIAVYDALQEDLASKGKASWGWPVFPEEYADFDSPAVAKFAKANAKRVQFFLWLQWQAALQFEKANKVAQEHKMQIGLYRDLAVGVSEGSAEIWGNKALYCTDASVGAPPDILGPLGQTWGLPPMDPLKLYEQAYQPIIDLFSSNMHATGALRIDHVMALLRLWWVPKGDSAKQGGYVYYPVDDLLAILALESHRNQAMVIGEDLGTVPEEIREKLADNGVYSYRVFFFEQAKDGGFFSPSHYPVQSMSTLTTHDMPTLNGFWHCDDLQLGKTLGLYPTEEILASLYQSRHDNKQAILDTLHGHGSISEEISRDVNQVGMTKALNFGMQTHMASGSSSLLSLQLEDWLEMDEPVNIPGTFNEYPNWQRKLSHSLQDIFANSELQSLAHRLTEVRRQAKQ
ncbi:4-alpha-glucanotransferase [Paraglaciecola chathamensis]|uniref:4-alpha-glucanotransferase n=1 Tax=Paraglaciecola chathamensis TaxID=368405 RepID=UPI00270CEC10|nr:4-alpha-glucanotransferase [Paraglaciecola chathamensis]MDO6559849.1 4-alpha-glucanotransferase [Paraglaciecola chathamensis]